MSKLNHNLNRYIYNEPVLAAFMFWYNLHPFWMFLKKVAHAFQKNGEIRAQGTKTKYEVLFQRIFLE